MNKKSKTMRLLFPQWQGGNNPDYHFGAELLACIVPKSESAETIRVPVREAKDQVLALGNGVKGETQLLEQLEAATEILEKHNPDKVIVLGGDCAVSQAPFDYLNGKYDGKLGVLWLDAHPDVATIEGAVHDHEMVLGNLLGRGAPRFAEKVKHPVQPSHVMFAGLIHDELRPRDQDVNRLNLRYADPATLRESSQSILDWIADNQIEHIAVHFDLDVLTPKDFRSIYPAEPYLESFGAAIGQMTLVQVVRVLTDISRESDIVGLTIAEHLPWDAFNLRKALAQLAIFQD